MPLNKSLSIRSLEPPDAAVISTFLRSQSPEYLRFFYAFGSDESEIAEILSASEMDIYSGVFWQAPLVGIFFLRGWDAGYEIPSFGVLIDEKYRGKAFLSLTVDAAKLICRLSGINRFMVKIHPDNIALRNVHRMGFYQTGVEESTGNVIFHLDF
jgi:RimJ/RimL family protein N-acetyltransferase